MVYTVSVLFPSQGTICGRGRQVGLRLDKHGAAFTIMIVGAALAAAFFFRAPEGHNTTGNGRTAATGFNPWHYRTYAKRGFIAPQRLTIYVRFCRHGW